MHIEAQPPLHIEQHSELDIGGEAGQNARRMIVVKKLSAKLKIELSAEIVYSFRNHFRLFFDIQVVIEAKCLHYTPPKK